MYNNFRCRDVGEVVYYIIDLYYVFILCYMIYLRANDESVK